MKKITTDGNSACAHIAYLMNDLLVIYPITPSSNMAEVADQMSSNKTLNVYNNVTKLTQMQSEAGVSGAVHGALTSGALTSTFTSSQGLLLMIPNMYKIAGELLPSVFYVASRSLATHALNIFCDHSDIYACMKTGFNIVCCNSVQEVNDLSIITQFASLKSSTPFICFFDGFRTSHELNTIQQTTKEELESILDFVKEEISLFKQKSFSSSSPYARGTNQNSDVFFQNRLASLPFYTKVIDSFKASVEKVKTITNRNYNTVEYYGDKNASDIVISFGSSIEVLKLAQEKLKNTGVINIRLIKPFDSEAFIKLLPKKVKNITILERNLDVNGVDSLTATITHTLYKHNIKANIYSGVYGLGGKEFTPDDALACFNNMKTTKKEYFTVGVTDDLSNTSLEVKHIFKDNDKFACRIYGYGSDGSVSSAKNIIKILGEQDYAQGYFDYDSKKSGSLTISHVRTSENTINKPFNSKDLDIILSNHPSFITKYDMTENLNQDGIFLINCPYSENELNNLMPDKIKNDIFTKNVKVYTIDANKIAKENNLGTKINTIMQTALFKLTNSLNFDIILEKIKQTIISSYSKKGEEIVNNNLNAILSVENSLNKIEINNFSKPQTNSTSNGEYFDKVIRPISLQKGNELAVSSFTANGEMPTGTSKLEKRGISKEIPQWIKDKCIECGRCSLLCPHSCLKAVLFDSNNKTPKNFESKKSFSSDKNYRLQLSPEDCTGCGVCVENCPVKALIMNEDLDYRKKEKYNLQYFNRLEKIDLLENNVKNMQFKPSYFEFSGACAGCGETPYIKLVTQMFGDRMLIANATGCSSIYGGSFPTCPYTKDKEGFGPAWANSLFEDNAEFGYGIAYARKIERENFIEKLKADLNNYSKQIKEIIQNFLTDTDNHLNNRQTIVNLKNLKLKKLKSLDKYVLSNLHLFIKPSNWIFGGDGWAYDIGFGGLDHVIASGENINILILDTELYSNTGGQTSKATPRGATAKFNLTGKTTMKKDLLGMLKTYKNVYLAKVAIGANPDQCIKAFEEAENFNGPSVILAYAPCINHGYDLRYSQTHVIDSVKSGYNTLFRYSPDLSPNLIIDSFDPVTDYQEYLNSENRYKLLSKTNPENKDKLLQQNEMDAKNYKKDLKN